MKRVKGAHGGAGAERGEVIIQVGVGLLIALAERLIAVALGAGLVKGGVGGGFKQVELGDGFDIVGGVFGKLGDGDLGEELADQVALKWAVIEKHHGVEADVQGLLNQLDVLGLVVPIGDKHGNVFFAQHHVGVLAKWQERVFVLVLAAHGEDDAAFGKVEKVVLEIVEGGAVVELAEADAVEAVVADDAAPERVVEIEDDTFNADANGGEGDVTEVFGDER